jgi:hypothetical protein
MAMAFSSPLGIASTRLIPDGRGDLQRRYCIRLRDGESLLSADMTVDTSEAFLEFQAAGVIFFRTLTTERWGARTFIVKDPDGNLLLFAGPTD